ncbi:MAG: peptidylprolyl isomerase [bacterium]|nr:peptidylprolyl isomerase [bacterium]
MPNEGDFVAISYIGKLEDGEIFDSTEGRPPFEFQYGSGMVIPGFEKAVADMEVNQEKDFVIEPEDAYGDYDDSLVHRFPLEHMKSQFDPKEGMMIGIQTEDGRQIPGTITEISDTEVVVDLNHMLAGKKLFFNIQLLEINSEPKYAQEGGCGCSDDSCSDDSCSDDSCEPGCSC